MEPEIKQATKIQTKTNEKKSPGTWTYLFCENKIQM